MSCPHCNNGVVDLLFTTRPCEFCNDGNEAPENQITDIPRYVARHLKDPRPLMATMWWGGKTFQVADEAQLMKALHSNLRGIDFYGWDQDGSDFKLKFKQYGISHKSGIPVTFLTTMTGEGTPGDAMDMINNILFMQSPWYDSVRVNASRAIGMLRQRAAGSIKLGNPVNTMMTAQKDLAYDAFAARRITGVDELVNTWWASHRCNIVGRCVDLGNQESDNALAISVDAGPECVQFSHTYLPGTKSVRMELNVLTK